jgi:hypothetical protein
VNLTKDIIRFWGFTIEYRPERQMWEVKEGAAHRGLFEYLEDARAFIRSIV